MPPFPTWPSKRSRKSRSEASFSSLTSLMMINQNLTRQITALKAEIEEAKSAIETVEKQVLCKACKTHDRGVYLTCGDLVCEPCAADVAAAEKKWSLAAGAGLALALFCALNGFLFSLRSSLRRPHLPSPLLANYTRYRDINPAIYDCTNCSYATFTANSDFTAFDPLQLNSDELILADYPPLLCRPDTFGYTEEDAMKLFPYTGFPECGWNRSDKRQFLHIDTATNTLWMNCSETFGESGFRGKFVLDLGSDQETLGSREFSDDFRDYETVERLSHNEEFAYATCDQGKTEGLENAVYHNRRNETVATRARRLGNGGKPLNILVLTLDSVSRRNFYRKMPKTVEFLRNVGEKFRVIDFKLSNVMGEYSADNILPMLYGDVPIKMLREIPDQDLFYDRSIYKMAKEHGFVTTFIEDNCGDDLARYIGKKVGVDHLGSYFWCAAVKFHNYVNNAPRQRCIGQLHSHFHAYGYILDVQRNYKGLSQFSFLHINTAHEPSGRLIETLDSDTVSFLSKLLSDPSTEYAVFLNGDHGMRYGDWFKKLDGSKEHRLPLLHVLLSDSLLSRVPNSYDTLTHNSNRLVSKLDLHTTLQHLVKQTLVPSISPSLYAGRLPVGLQVAHERSAAECQFTTGKGEK